MKKISSKYIALILFTTSTIFLLSFPIVFYTKILPYAVSNEKLINKVKNIASQKLNAEITIKKPVLQTSLNSDVIFKIEELSVSKNYKKLFLLEKLDTHISLKDIMKKKIILKKIILDNIFIELNELQKLFPPKKVTNQSNNIEIEWLNALLELKNCSIVYKLNNDTTLTILNKNFKITKTKEPKFVDFDLNIKLKNKIDNININLTADKNIYIKNHKLFINKGTLLINKSKVWIDAEASNNEDFKLRIYSNQFNVKNAIELLQTNLIIPNATELLAFYKDIKGTFNFVFDITKTDINGKVRVNESSLKIIPINNLPINILKGVIFITKDTITFNDFMGYYGTSKLNKVTFTGTVKDYTSSVDTNIEAYGVATNDLMKNYISQLVGIPITLIGNSNAKVLIKSKFNKIALTYMGKIAKGDDILVDGASLSPIDYDRAFVADFIIDGNNLEISSIKYFIAKELNKDTKNIKPILTIDGLIDIATMQIKKIGFDIPNPLPSEFLNVLIGQKVFQKGTISGNMYYLLNKNVPKLNGNLQMEKVFVPSQRLSIKKAILNTHKNSININASGRFKRSIYNFKGYIKNSLLFPITIKDINLSVDNIDIEKLLTSMTQQNNNAQPQTNKIEIKEISIDEAENSYDSYTFDTNLLLVENCILEVIKGVYKDIKFGNLKANLTLDKNGILKIKSNKFDFAEGISTLKILCDLKKHQYNIRLGIKDINSDLIASTLLALPREITGKARGLIELNTDDSLKLNGNIKFDIKNGTIQKVGLVEYALKFAALFRNPMAMISPSTIFDLVNIPEGNFDKINGDLILKNNIIEKIMIQSSADQLSSFIIGKYDLETKDAALRIYTKFSNKNKGLSGFMRNISLNSLANRVTFSNDNESMYYSKELEKLPPINADEKDCQVFLTKVDGDIEHFNFLSSLKKIK